MGFPYEQTIYDLNLKKNFCTTVLHHWGIHASFDKPLQEYLIVII